MAKTLTEALAEIRDDIDEQTAVHWTEAQLIRYMNRGIEKTATMSECLRDEVTKAIVAGTYEYTMSGMDNDIIRFTTSKFVRTGDTTEYPLRYYDLLHGMHEFGSSWQQVSGTPQAFTTWNNPPSLKIKLFPVPAEDGTLTIYYYRKPTLHATNGDDNGENIDLPPGWEAAAVCYARYRAFKFDGQLDQAELELQEFNDTLGALSATRFTDQPGQVTMVGQAGLPHWLVNDMEW